jgi:hypothetical protein
MKSPITFALVASLVTGGTALGIASAQDRTQQPGQPTQARVWIQNQGDAEAVPVRIRGVASDSPLRVQVSGTPTVTTGPGSVVQARLTRQPWEYRTVRIAAGQDLATVLNTAGADGWEATSVTSPIAGETAVLMKRPK